MILKTQQLKRERLGRRTTKNQDDKKRNKLSKKAKEWSFNFDNKGWDHEDDDKKEEKMMTRDAK